MQEIAFWILSIGAIVSAAFVVLPPMGRNPVHAALWLVLGFFFLAGLYVMLVAPLLATLQILVYAGAIIVLFLFVIMLLNLRPEELGQPRPTLWKAIGVGATAAFASWLFAAFRSLPRGSGNAPVLEPNSHFGSLDSVAQVLYTRWLVPFELTSVLLLVAIVGALVMAKRRLQ